MEDSASTWTVYLDPSSYRCLRATLFAASGSGLEGRFYMKNRFNLKGVWKSWIWAKSLNGCIAWGLARWELFTRALSQWMIESGPEYSSCVDLLDIIGIKIWARSHIRPSSSMNSESELWYEVEFKDRSGSLLINPPLWNGGAKFRGQTLDSWKCPPSWFHAHVHLLTWCRSIAEGKVCPTVANS